MRMSKKVVLWASLLGILGVIVVLLMPREPQKPQLVVVEPTFNMGTVPLGQVGHYKVQLTNAGNATLEINGLSVG